MSCPNSLLRAFRHPLVVVSILVLLLNDHILKGNIPSWLTGKLSDFAGLFFFPFLLGVGIQAGLRIACMITSVGCGPCGRPLRLLANYSGGHQNSPPANCDRTLRSCDFFKVSPHIIMLSSLLLTALVFTAIKTAPTANTFAALALSRLFFLPVRIALDPTDLMALVVLLPAWKLWQKIETNSLSAAPGKRAYLALSLGALASLATAPCPAVVSIQRLAVSGDTLFAGSVWDFGQTPPAAYASRDQAKTWELGQGIPAEVSQALTTPARLPLTRCEPADPQTCYRIDGQPRVEASLDGGKTWKTAWRIPPEREPYIRRVASKPGLIAGCGGKTADLRTFDMVFLPGSQPPVLVIAMGNEGLLIHSSGQGWQRTDFAMYDTTGKKQPYNPAPTPFAARSFSEAWQQVPSEGLAALATGLLVYLVFSVLAWMYAASHPWPGAKSDAGWVLSPARWLFIWLLLLVVTWLLSGFRLPFFSPVGVLNELWLVAVVLFPFGSLIISAVIWRRGGALSPHPANFSRLGWLALLIGAGIYGITMACFLLWALGFIPVYETAAYLSIALDLAALAGGIFSILYGLRRAFAG